MKTRTLLIMGVAAVAVGYSVRSCGSSEAPDERIAGRFEDVCGIARRNLSTPERGVDELFAFLGKQTPDLLHDWGELFVSIERIADDKQHDDRARLAHERIIESADKGMAIVVISTDLDELIKVSDRIGVMFQGRLAGIVENGPDVERRVGLLMTGVEAA